MGSSTAQKDPIADPQTDRSPCLACAIHISGRSKDNEVCENCSKRLEFVKEHCGPANVDDLIKMSGKEIIPERPAKLPKFCKICGGLHYAKGLCVSCYYKHWWKEHGKPQFHGASLTLRFAKLPSGSIMLNLLKMIAEREHHTPAQQAIVFIAKGVLDWLEEHD